MSTLVAPAEVEVREPASGEEVEHDRPWVVIVWNDPINLMSYVTFVFQKLFGRLRAVGQMALTNYLMQSVLCTLFFFGYGLGFYERLAFHQLYLVVFAVWVLQLAYSPIWLRHFRFGPVEWLWRSLTYWQAQPMWR